MLHLVWQADRWQEALDLLDSFQVNGVQPNTIACNALIKALGSARQWQAVSDCLLSKSFLKFMHGAPSVFTMCGSARYQHVC